LHRSLRGCRVLVVEDEPIIALAIEDMLLDLGCEVIGPATALAEANRLAAEADLDAAVLDVNMGGGNTSGSVAVTLRSRSIPLCFSTGYRPEQMPGGFESAPLIHKPYSSENLAAVLQGLISVTR